MQYNFPIRIGKLFFAQSKAEAYYRKGFNTIFYSTIATTLVIVIYISLINLSTKQFKQKTLYADIKQIAEESQLETQYIEIEITESTAMDDFLASIAIMKKIRDLGIEVSIDDYGTGYSSLES